MSILRYISHPDVVQDPQVPVPQWRLSERGLKRAETMLEVQPWVAGLGRVVSSAETKAQMMAEVLANHLGVAVETRPGLGETDRSATGYVSAQRHDDLARRFFGDPIESADGWETAVAAQERVVRALADLIAAPPISDQGGVAVDIAVIGHGGVGTLLRCHLAGLPIDQCHDQPGQGHFWSFDRTTGAVLHDWMAIDAA